MSLQVPRNIVIPTGLVYTAVMFRVLSRDEFGRPEQLSICQPDVPIEIVEGDQFLVAYIDGRQTEKKGCSEEET